MKETKKTWLDIDLEQYLQILDIDKTQEDTDVAIDLVSIVYRCNADELPLDTFKKYLNSIDLRGEIPNVSPKKIYRVDGREYLLDMNSAPSVAQFYDYQNLIKEKAPFNKLLVPILIPKGIKYGSPTHNFDQCEKDFLKLPIIDVVSIANFLQASWEVLLTIFRQSMEKEIRTNEALTKPEKKERIQLMREGFRNLISSGYFPSYLLSAKKQTSH